MKPNNYDGTMRNTMSHPAGVRGLKLMLMVLRDLINPSHPAGVRGLKQNNQSNYLANRNVAPRWGAWIETFPCPASPSLASSHPA
ncbi:MAG: hypothetical protein P1P82_17605, partial [Bacteroidales bacterium]|nr:hypothetical protein [Bacteroidales bacterium]